MKKKIALITLILAMGLTACEKRETKPEEKKELSASTPASSAQSREEGDRNIPYLKKLVYSNLVDKETRRTVSEALIKAGLSKKRVKRFEAQVKEFNETVGTGGFVEKGFQEAKKFDLTYDVERIVKKWDKKFSPYIGNNCRLTTFGLLGDLIEIKNEEIETDRSNLFMDSDAIENDPHKTFDEKESERFFKLFSNIPTEATKDISVHLGKVKEAWKKLGLHFKEDTKASMVSVVFHSSFSEKENNLFIGHVGVLVPLEDGSLLFVEKLAYEEPYQAVKIANRTELNDYLMGTYDVEWNQPTASPFILENGDLIEGYRANPNKKNTP